MDYKEIPHVRYKKEDAVMTLVIDWPEGQNAMDYLTMESIIRVYEEADSDPEVKVLFVTGSNGYFNTGGKCDTANPEEKDRYNRALEKMSNIQREISIPVIVGVNGDCKAGGMMFVARADFAISLDTASFGFPEIKAGAFPMAVMAPLVDLIPRKQAFEFFVSGDDFTPQTAKEVGLINAVADAAHFEDVVSHYVDIVKKVDRSVMRIGKKCFKDMCKLVDEKDRIDCGIRALQEVWAARASAQS